MKKSKPGDLYNKHKKNKKWIQDMHIKKDALHAELGVKKGNKIPTKKLATAAKKGGIVGKRARLAETLKSFHHKKTKKTKKKLFASIGKAASKVANVAKGEAKMLGGMGKGFINAISGKADTAVLKSKSKKKGMKKKMMCKIHKKVMCKKCM